MRIIKAMMIMKHQAEKRSGKLTKTFKNRIPLTILILGILGAGSDLAMPPRVADPAQTSEQTLVKKYLRGGSAGRPLAPCKEISEPWHW